MESSHKMEASYKRLLDGNKIWSDTVKAHNPEFFRTLAEGQQPEYLWIGCSDSRVPANEITGTKSGQIFVHRNVANIVINTDFNLLSVLYYAVDVLKVKHIIVCGHYGCGGVIAAMGNSDIPYVNDWLRNIKEVYIKNRAELEAIENQKDRENRLVELNVIEQARNLAKTKIVQKAWKERALQVHGWVYGLNDGVITDLQVMIDELEDLEPIFRYAL